MKPRHFIMILVLIIFSTVMLSLKSAKNTKTLTCSVNDDFQGLDSHITLNVKVSNNEIKDMNITIDSVLPEEYQSQKLNIITSINSEGKMQATSTKDGIRFETGIKSEYFKSLNLSTKTNYRELKESLELQGYSCK